MKYEVRYTKNAVKQMRSIPQGTRELIFKKVSQLAQNPKAAGQVKALKDEEGHYRLRVGDYRVVYNQEHDALLILVVKVKHRKDVYR